MNHEKASGISLPDASVDTFDLDLVEFDRGNDPRADDISSFYEYLEEAADERTCEELIDKAVSAAIFPDASRHSISTESSACCDNQHGCLEPIGEVQTAGRSTIENVKSPRSVGSGGSKDNNLSIEELVQCVIEQGNCGAITRETNAFCAQILNHPEVTRRPDLLPIRASYNGKDLLLCKCVIIFYQPISILLFDCSIRA